MKKLFSCLLTLLGINTACGQQPYIDMDVEGFASLVGQADVQLLDVRTAEEYAAGHLDGAFLADVKQDNFAKTATALLDKSKRVAVYCRSGRRSANAARQLSALGFEVVNLQGGIEAWKTAGKPVTTLPQSDVFTSQSGAKVELFPLMHASLLLDINGSKIYVDPVGKLGERTIDYTTLPNAELILVTHEHGDHFDKAAIATLTAQGTSLITNQRCADQLGYGHVMGNGDNMQMGNLHIDAVPAYNTTAEHLQFHPKGRDNGFIISYDGLRIYIAGDTEDIPEMSQLRDIDIAFLPCNQPYTMTVEQLVKAARTIKPKVLYPYHYSKTDISGLPSLLSADGIEVRLRAWE